MHLTKTTLEAGSRRHPHRGEGQANVQAIRVRSGRTLAGEVRIEGAKNSALKLMAATIMASGTSTLTNVPDISDVHIMGKVLKRLGAGIVVRDRHCLEIDTSAISSYETPYELVVQMRASTAVLGPLIARFGKAVVAMPGGCDIGSRKIDMHLMGLNALGVEFNLEHGDIEASAPEGLHGATVNLDFASVGATENLMMAAVLAKGETIIYNAAREPEIVDLAVMLNDMGADVKGAGTPIITINGVDELCPVSHAVVGDRIEAGTFVAAAALAGDGVMVRGFDPEHLGLVFRKYEAMGLNIEPTDDGCLVGWAGRPQALDIQTLPFPGFPTDLQAPTMTILSVARGNCIITENVFENRFRLADELCRMGADIHIEGHHAIIHGVSGLSGARVQSPDLRGGAALVVAGLIADGYTEITDIQHIRRGYDRFVEKLAGLGADIELVEIGDDED